MRSLDLVGEVTDDTGRAGRSRQATPATGVHR